ncbi:ABC transporter D family member 1 [Camellia lanceoleosa]|nr:ABC transporter D family member 1 [Camellia lanceoleosa]
MKLALEGGVAILYAYMFLECRVYEECCSDFGDPASREQQLEGTFRWLNQDLRTFLITLSYLFRRNGYLVHLMTSSQSAPHNVTWALSLLYAMVHKGDRALTSTHASVVSQSFLTFGDILELHRKYLGLSGGIKRIFEREELLDVAQKGPSLVSSIF